MSCSEHLKTKKYADYTVMKANIRKLLMKNIYIGIIAFALGIGMATSMRGSFLSAQAASSMGAMNSKMSSADVQMQEAMSRMNDSMKNMRMSGDTDRDFMKMMIPHHQSAIGMARIELRYGHRRQLKSLARNIVSSQGREIGEMRAFLREWYGE